ncbi:hypothetical protein D7027_02220 [Ochrobactrum intermedium]|uniref:hypothetical protein n=1 Tax=Brucella intermedia TaxID=94625 RepID=UPI00128C2B9F|nr:hypothetical protein [Brucella intermedia]MPR60648.1 hypothetical protein [Brucella intermedia]
MTTTFEGKIGFFRIKQKYSKSDRFVSVAKGCIHLPPDALAAIGVGVGDKYSVTRGNERGEIVVRKAKSYTAPILREPEVIRFQPTFVIEFLGNNAGVSAQEMPLSDISFELVDGALVGRLPDTVQTSALQDRKRRVADSDVDWRDVVRGYHGAAAALALDAHRNSLKGETPKSLPISEAHMIWLLREEGHRVSQINERLWRLDDRTATLGDLIQLARKYEDGLVLVAA